MTTTLRRAHAAAVVALLLCAACGDAPVDGATGAGASGSASGSGAAGGAGGGGTSVVTEARVVDQQAPGRRRSTGIVTPISSATQFRSARPLLPMTTLTHPRDARVAG